MGRGQFELSDWESHCVAAARAWEESAKSWQAKAVPPKGVQGAPDPQAAQASWEEVDRDFREARRWRELGESPVAKALIECDLSDAQREFIFNCSSAGWVGAILESGLECSSKQRRDVLRCEKLAEYLKSALLWGSKDIEKIFNGGEPFSSTGPSGYGRLAKRMRQGRLATAAGVFGPMGVYAAGIATSAAGWVGSSPAFTSLVVLAGAAFGVGMGAMTFKRTPDVAAAGKLLSTFEPRVDLRAAKAFLRSDAFVLEVGESSTEPRGAVGQAVDAMMAGASKDWILGSEYNHVEEVAACGPLLAAVEAREIGAGAAMGRAEAKRSKSI